MFYLTYRPRTLDELDNTQVKQVIINILKQKEIPHALLFVGGKGMGKTSTARIVAKAVNCAKNMFSGQGTSYEPCNTCDNCTSIDVGSNSDVVEQDAASNRGIEEIRKLIKESAFAPMTGKYRVYIIDEAHMITTDAFNALLKTLEEPPRSVIFILATTNEEKIPETIGSRCVRIAFGQAESSDIIHMLDRMAQAEKISLSPEIKELIVMYSENSFRDAAKLFEELVIQNKLDLARAREYLGVRGTREILGIIAHKPLHDALAYVSDLEKSGGSTKRAIEEMLQTLRKQLLFKNGIGEKIDDLGLTVPEITQLMRLLHDAYKNLRFTPIESLPLEIALVEFYNLRKRS